MIRSVLPAALLLIPAAGCGSGAASSPGDAVRSYHAAVAGADGQKACERLDSTAQRELQDSTQGAIRGSCRDVIEALASFYDETTKDRLRDVEVETETQGDTATATFVSPVLGGNRRQVYELRRVDGDWKIDSLGLTDTESLSP